ncbi:phage holin family protein [Microbacterium sp. 179-I 3D4 NHS]|uniref:phage holin family protein n=1 Tax=Microbacterium sp. 179-I 3D4 NHS TaxID=3142381 RepID=UPI0039A007A3
MADEPTPSEEKAATTSLGELVSEVTRDISVLMRQELALAKAEVKESATTAGKGAGMLGGAAYAASMAVLFLSLAAWWGIGYLTGLGWSALIVMAIWAIIALVLFLNGKRQLKDITGAPRTVESLKKIPDTLKRNEENR